MPARAHVPDDFGSRPFTLADARAIGLSKHVVRGSRFRRIFRGVYIRAAVEPTAAVRHDAVARLTAEPFWSTCRTAAELYGVPVPPTMTTHIGLPPGVTGPRCAGLTPHRTTEQPEVRLVGGRRVASPEAAFRQLASLAGRPGHRRRRARPDRAHVSGTARRRRRRH